MRPSRTIGDLDGRVAVNRLSEDVGSAVAVGDVIDSLSVRRPSPGYPFH